MLKERDVQVELNALKEKAQVEQDREWLIKAQREYEDSIRRDQEKAVKRMQASESNRQFIFKQ